MSRVVDFVCLGEKMFSFFKKYCSWHFDSFLLIFLGVALVFASIIPSLSESCGYENSVIENLQMLVLFVAFGISLTAKEYKKFYLFVGLAVSIILLREVNFGRTLFFCR